MKDDEFRHTEHSRCILLGYLLGHTSSLDSSISGDGLDEWRAVGVNQINIELRNLNIKVNLRDISMTNLVFNANIIIDTMEEKAEHFFRLGLSIALLQMRHVQGLTTNSQAEQTILHISEQCGVREFVEPIFENGKNAKTFNLVIEKLIRHVASLSAERPICDFEKWAGSNLVALAIVFTDVVGASSLGQKLGGEVMEKVRQAHFKQTRLLISKYEGWEIKTMGDSFMVAFRNVANALDFAIELQSNSGHAQIKIRIGIHIGSLLIRDNDAFGNNVDFASRIVNSIEGAGVRISDHAKKDIDLLRAVRHVNLKWNRIEGIKMKNFPEKHILWSLA